MSARRGGVTLARVDELTDPCAVVVRLGGDPFQTAIVTRRGDVIAAFRNRCPHAGHPLQRADGRILVQEGRYLVCGGHGASFTLEHGACAGGPCNGDGLDPIAIEIADGVVRTRV